MKCLSRKGFVWLGAAALAGCSGGAAENNFVAANEIDSNAAIAVDPVAEPASGNDAVAAGNAASGNASAAPETDDAAAKPGASFKATGSEPFWALTLTDSKMAYDSADGPDVTVATPKAQHTRSGPVYSTPALKVQIDIVRHCTHEDGETKGDTVKVTVGGQTVTGCGNGDLPD